MITDTRQREIKIPVEDWCHVCLGSGVVYAHPKNQAIERAEKCRICNGSGRRRV